MSTNPLKFTQNLGNTLQTQFNDSTLQIFFEDYYGIEMKNFCLNRFQSYENFSTQYSTSFGAYQVCTNSTNFLSEYQMNCVLRTKSNNFFQCNLNSILKNDSIELTCECDKFGDIFLVTSTNFSIRNGNNTNQQTFTLDIASISEGLAIIIVTGSLSLIFLAIYILQLKKEYQTYEVRLDTEQINLSPSKILNKNKLFYRGNFKVFKEKFQQIHQTISIFYYQDKSIHLVYRILEVLSQFNFLLTLIILECNLLSNQIVFIYVFLIVNQLIIFILRMFYKIFEAIYRFKRIAAFISQFLIIMLLITPNLIIFIFYFQKYVLFYFRIQSNRNNTQLLQYFLGIQYYHK